MKNSFSYSGVVLKVTILSLISTSSGQDQDPSNHRNLNSSKNLAVSTPAFSHSNHSIANEILNNELKHGNNTVVILDKVFGVDRRIFEEFLKDEDLKIIPGLRDDDDLDNWEPPLEIQRDLPAYMSGFDYEDRPIWVTEFGKWKLDKYAGKDKATVALFEKYNRYISYNALKSHALRSTKERRVTRHNCLFDAEGLSPAYLTNRKIIGLQLKWSNLYRRYSEKYFHKVVAINVNQIAEVLLNLIRNFYTRFLGKIEIYGSNKYTWVPKLLKNFPKDQLPEWYGGNKGAVPLYRLG